MFSSVPFVSRHEINLVSEHSFIVGREVAGGQCLRLACFSDLVQ